MPRRATRNGSTRALFGVTLALGLVVSDVVPTLADTAGSGSCLQTFTRGGNGTASVAVQESGGFCYVAFRNTGSAGTQSSFSWSRPANVTSVNVLVVGGGGGGGSRHGGGGGAGAFVEATAFDISSASTISVTVGAGGTGGTENSYVGTNGQNSAFLSVSNGLTALGGGFGANANNAGSGGSGGGAGAGQTPGQVQTQNQTTFGASSLTGITFGSQGAAGASDPNNSGDTNDFWAGGGGGGAGGAGSGPTQDGVLTNAFTAGSQNVARGGNGGAGRSVSWLPVDVASSLSVGQARDGVVFFAGGGGGGMGADGFAGGSGGVGGGANGSKYDLTPNNGLVSTGGGGGGSGFDDSRPNDRTSNNAPAGAGGSGVVVVRYALLAGSAKFSGANQDLRFAQNQDWNLGTGDFTIEWFQYQTSTSTWPRVFSVGSWPNSDIAVSIEAGTVYVWLEGSFRIAYGLGSTSNYFHKWVHFAISRASGTLSLYVDGTRVASTSNSSDVQTTLGLTIGSENGNSGTFFPGYITNFHWVKGSAIYTGSSLTVPTSPIQKVANTKLLLLHSTSATFLSDSSDSAKSVLTNNSVVFDENNPFRVSVPDAPTITSISASAGGATINFDLSYNGGRAITSYQYRIDSGSWINASSTSSPLSISGLTPGTQYSISIRAVNSIGPSVSSNAINVTPLKSSTTLTWSPSPTTLFLDSATHTPTALASANSAGAITYSVFSAGTTGCTVDAILATISFTAAGTCVIRATVAETASNQSATRNVTFTIQQRTFTVTYSYQGATGDASIPSATFTVGGQALVLPSPSRTSYVFTGWYSAQTGGTKIGDAGATFSPGSSQTLYARWVQLSLYGMGQSTKIGTITTVNGFGNSYSATSGGTSVSITYAADALPAGTVIDVYLLGDTARAQSLINTPSSFVVNLVVAWLAPDGTVPSTVPGKPIEMTITNSSIKRGASLYALLGDQVQLLGTATQDGTATIQITDDPEIVVAATKPAAPSNVIGSAGNTSADVSWTAPSSGGSEITSYTVTATPGGATCSTTSTSCTITGLVNGTSYTFAVTATNAVGTSTAGTSGTVTPSAPQSSSGSGQVSSPSIPAPITTPTPNPTPGSNPAPRPGGVSTTPRPTPGPTAPPSQIGFTPTPPATPVSETGPVGSIIGGSANFQIKADLEKEILVAEAGAWKLEIKPPKSQDTPQPVTASLGLQLSVAAETKISGTGLQPNTTVEAWVFSEPTYIGTIKVGPDGTFASSLNLPRNLLPGQHTLQIGSLNSQGRLVTLSVPITIKGSVTVGTFKGFVAIFTKDLQGQELTARVAGKWIRQNPVRNFKTNNYSRLVRFTGAGYDIVIDVYINKKFYKRYTTRTR